MPKGSTWHDVEKGASVKIRGRVYVVEKIKRDGKRATVKLSHRGTTSKGTVKLKDPVELADPLRDARGAQRRWATKREHDAILAPPNPPSDRAWTKAQGPIEKRVKRELGARLIGEADDADAGYYVPPVDVTTVALHMAIFHGGTGGLVAEADMLKEHERQHAAALKKKGVLDVNHWHTDTRP